MKRRSKLRGTCAVAQIQFERVFFNTEEGAFLPSDHGLFDIKTLVQYERASNLQVNNHSEQKYYVIHLNSLKPKGQLQHNRNELQREGVFKRECLVMRKSPLRFSLAKGFPRCKTTMKSPRPTRSGGGRLAEQTLSQGAHLPCSHLSDGTGFNSSFVIPVCSQ